MTTVWVAYSGGLDSHVLLHALAQLREQLSISVQAIHIAHGLQPEAESWPAHCRRVCAALDVPLTVVDVNAHPMAGESPEAVARAARYEALAERVRAEQILVTAQHKQDQAETLLLQLLRGAGARGQSAMPEVSRLGSGRLVRPLLMVTQGSLNQYADENGLQWLEDASNKDVRFDRNFLRHDVMPVLRSRWPQIDHTLSRVAGLQAETEQLLNELASSDMISVGDQAQRLSIPALLALTPPRQRNLLRYWLHSQGMRLPSERKLRQVQADLLTAGADKNPCISWEGVELRRYRTWIYAMPPLSDFDARTRLEWKLGQILTLPGEMGQLSARASQGQGIQAEMVASGSVSVMYRQGGERIKPLGRDHHHSLKQLFQEAGIPTWQRDRTPLLYVNDELAAIANLCVSAEHAATGEMAGVVIDWQQAK